MKRQCIHFEDNGHDFLKIFNVICKTGLIPFTINLILHCKFYIENSFRIHLFLKLSNKDFSTTKPNENIIFENKN